MSVTAKSARHGWHRWSSRTGRRSRLLNCARFLRISRSRRGDRDSLCKPAPVFRRGVWPRNAQDGASSSSAITARCAIARACLRSIAFLRICSRMVRRFRASWPLRPAKRRSKQANGLTKSTKSARSRSLRGRNLVDALPQRRPCAIRWSGAGAASSCRAGVSSRRRATTPARRQLHDLRRNRILVPGWSAIWLRARRLPVTSCARMRGAGSRVSRAVSFGACAAPARAGAALDAQRSARLESVLE